MRHSNCLPVHASGANVGRGPSGILTTASDQDATWNPINGDCYGQVNLLSGVPLALMGFWTHLLAILPALGLVGFVVKLFLAGQAPWNPEQSSSPLHKDT